MFMGVKYHKMPEESGDESFPTERGKCSQQVDSFTSLESVLFPVCCEFDW